MTQPLSREFKSVISRYEKTATSGHIISAPPPRTGVSVAFVAICAVEGVGRPLPSKTQRLMWTPCPPVCLSAT